MDYLKVLRYIVSGGTAALVNLATLYTLTEWFSWWYLHSSIVAFAVALLVSFTLQKFWTFRDRAPGRTHRQFFLYVLVIITNLGLNTLILYTLVDFIQLPYLAGQVVAGGLLAIGSFFVYRRFIFVCAI